VCSSDDGFFFDSTLKACVSCGGAWEYAWTSLTAILFLAILGLVVIMVKGALRTRGVVPLVVSCRFLGSVPTLPPPPVDHPLLFSQGLGAYVVVLVLRLEADESTSGGKGHVTPWPSCDACIKKCIGGFQAAQVFFETLNEKVKLKLQILTVFAQIAVEVKWARSASVGSFVSRFFIFVCVHHF
jgi:hypothetical protein